MQTAPLDEEIRRELAPGEQVLWSGRPRQGLVLRGSDAFAIPFSLLWCGFAIFWEASVLNSNAPGFFALWGIPFVAVGLYIVVGRFFVEAWQRTRTYYAVTNERALIVSGVFRREVRSLNVRALSDVALSEHRAGAGTIWFGRPPSSLMWFGSMPGWPGTRMALIPRFEMIPDARPVFDLIRRAQREMA